MRGTSLASWTNTRSSCIVLPMRKAIFATAVLLVGCGYRSEPTGGATDHCGNIKTVQHEIVNGVEEHDPEVVDLTGSQIRSIGALNLDLTGTCTATLVAPDVVLTAAHCVEGVDSPMFLVGESFLPPEVRFRATEVHVHPEYRGSSGGMASPPFDLAVLIIDGDTEAEGLEPIPVNMEERSLLGEIIQSVGYGAVEEGGGGFNTRRYWTTQDVISEAPAVYTVSDAGESGLCYGDSGGPMLWTVPGQGPTIMGVASAIDSDTCLGNGLYARTDIAAEWLEEFLDEGPCEGETYEGRCQGDMAVWCDEEEIFYHVCSDFGWECGEDDEGLHRCMPPCRDETFDGRCRGDLAVWCAEGEIYYHDCHSFGWICGLDEDGHHRCIPPEPCEGITFDGICDGNVAVWCEDDELWYHYCDDFGFTCGEGPDGRFRCLDECWAMGHEGQCAGDTARWCDHGTILERDCRACHQECGWTGEALGYYCM